MFAVLGSFAVLGVSWDAFGGVFVILEGVLEVFWGVLELILGAFRGVFVILGLFGSLGALLGLMRFFKGLSFSPLPGPR